MALTPREKAIRQRLKDDYPHYAEKCLKIRAKSGAIEPLIFNDAQKFVHEKLEEQRQRLGYVRALILKGRQQGISTYVGGRYYHKATHARGRQVFILTHEDAATQNLFDMVERYHENCPAMVRPVTGAANAKELAFSELDSGYKVGTAGTKGVGRSGTYQLFHGSEAGYWPNAQTHAAGVLQAVPNEPDTEIILESTANGMGNFFHQAWRDAVAGKSEFIAIFVPWYWQHEYRRPVPEGFALDEEEIEYQRLYSLDLEQMVWRRYKIVELRDPLLFKQEYPACIAAGQRVGTSRGILPIELVAQGDITAHGAVTFSGSTGTKDTLEIKTALGYRLIATPDHRVKMADGEWKAASELLSRQITLSPPKFAGSHFELAWNPLPCVQSTLVISDRFARLLGFFMGDGCWHGGILSISCDAKDADVIDDVRSLLSEFVGRPTERTLGPNSGCVELRVGNAKFEEVLDRLGVIRRNTNPHRIVKVPDVIWKSPASSVREFLRGLFESDGFSDFEVGRVSLFSKHVSFLRDVQLLILGFGITSRLNSREANNKRYTYIANTLNLRVSESARFASEIGFVSSRKSGVVKPRTTGRPPKPIVLADTVVSIEKAGARPVYDLSVPQSSSFDANGICVHNCAEEAFQFTGEDSYIKPELIMRARKTTCKGVGPLILGVDPSRGGDRFSVAFRQGRKFFGVENRQDVSVNDVIKGANFVKQLIDEDKPDAAFIDVGGGGAEICDILRSWGAPYKYIVRPINFGGAPQSDTVLMEDGSKRPGPRNRRAEMYMRSRDWLIDVGGADMPDDDSIQADACAAGYTYDLQQRLIIESKEHMKARGCPSPDQWDAFILTFAEPVEHQPHLYFGSGDDDFAFADNTRSDVTGY